MTYKSLVRVVAFGVFLCLTLVSRPAHGLIQTEIEPIVGYIREQKLIPNRHVREKMFYGVRVTAGLLMIKGEAEVTQYKDTEYFADQGLSVFDTVDRAKLGLRGQIKIFSMLRAFVRGGGSAKRKKHEERSPEGTTVVYEPIKYRPYLGAGLTFVFTRHFRFRADMTTVFNDFPNFNDNEYEVSAGFVVSFP